MGTNTAPAPAAQTARTLVSTQPAATGYDAMFLGRRVPAPSLNSARAKDAVKLNGSPVLHYTHFSLAMSKARRFCHWVAWNIDGGSIKKVSRSNLSFVFDHRIPLEAQAGNDLYSDNRLDRGHLARRADVVWGTLEEATRANKDSFFYTNITPQMDDFNQSTQRGVWGRLEDAVFDDVDVDDLKVSVFGGPIFRKDDRFYRGVQIPRDFWKVIAYSDKGALKTKGFVLTQNLNLFDALDLDEFRVFQVSLPEIEDRTAVRFAAEVKRADTFVNKLAATLMAGTVREPLRSTSDIAW